MESGRNERRLVHLKVDATGILLGGEDFGVGGLGGGSCGNYVEGGVYVSGYWREADFGAAGLVAEFHRNVLRA